MLPLVVLAALLGDDGCSPPPDGERRAEAASAYLTGVQNVFGQKWAEAEKAFAAAVERDPGLPLAHYGRGQALMALARYAEAVLAFSLSRDAFACAGQLPLEARIEADRRLDQEIDELRDSIRRFDTEHIVVESIPWQEVNGAEPGRMGRSTREIHDMERRLAELELLRKRGWNAKPPPEVPLALGTALFQTGALAEAEREFRAALESDPGSGDAQNNLAVVFLATGRLDEAERAMQRAEKAGVAVNPRLKDEIRRRKAAAPR